MADIPSVDVVEPAANAPSRSRNESDSDRTLGVEDVRNITTKDEDIPPDGGYGWVCVACNFFINAHTWGINSSYGVFLSYYLSSDYFPDTSPLVYAFIGGLSMSMALLIAPLATRFIHWYGTRTTLYVGVFFETLSLITSSFATKKYQIILSQGVCFGWGLGFLFVGSVGIIPQWFLKKRSLANAIAAAGSGLGGLMYSLVAQRIIDTMGLRWAYRILGVCTFAVNAVASTLLRDRNKQVGSRYRGFDIALLKRPELLLIQGWAFFSLLGYVILIFSLATYAATIGLSAQQGSIVAALFNLGQMVGRPFIGLASDKYGRLNVATFFSFLCGIFCFVFWLPDETASSKYGLLIFFALVGGAFAGTFWCTIATVGAEVVGLRNLPAALSLTWLGLVLPTTFAEPIALELRKKPGQEWRFLYAQIFTALAYVVGAACLWVVRGWKVGEMEATETHVMEQRRRESFREQEAQTREKAELVEESIAVSIAKEAWNRKGLIRRMGKLTVV